MERLWTDVKLVPSLEYLNLMVVMELYEDVQQHHIQMKKNFVLITLKKRAVHLSDVSTHVYLITVILLR